MHPPGVHLRTSAVREESFLAAEQSAVLDRAVGMPAEDVEEVLHDDLVEFPLRDLNVEPTVEPDCKLNSWRYACRIHSLIVFTTTTT